MELPRHPRRATSVSLTAILYFPLRAFVAPLPLQALYASKICSYAQGMNLIKAASAEFGWKVDLAECARIWKGGCIIRAGFLDRSVPPPILSYRPVQHTSTTLLLLLLPSLD